MTDSKGRAAAKGLRLNDISGKFQIKVEASYRGSTATASISQANAVLTAGTAAAGISGKLLVILAAAGAAAGVGAVLATTSGGKLPARGNLP
jgi:hypothetical protein